VCDGYCDCDDCDDETDCDSTSLYEQLEPSAYNYSCLSTTSFQLNEIIMCRVYYVVEHVPCVDPDDFICKSTIHNYRRCIQKDYVCDGHNDCLSDELGLDETFCGELCCIVLCGEMCCIVLCGELCCIVLCGELCCIVLCGELCCIVLCSG
jgi:hypothetical protein